MRGSSLIDTGGVSLKTQSVRRDGYMPFSKDSGLVTFTPVKPPTVEPITDEITGKMAKLMLDARRIVGDMAPYRCPCGGVVAGSMLICEKLDTVLHPLAVHFLAFHREEIPQRVLDDLKRVETDMVYPSFMALGDIRLTRAFFPPAA